MKTLKYVNAFFLLINIYCYPIMAQNSHDWIRFDDSKYIKIGVKEEGIYKVSFQELRDAGLSITSDKTEYLQLFHKGVEVPILDISDESIMFFGEKNKGASDSLLFRPHSARVNKHISLFSDMSYYYLTIGKTIGKRADIVDIKGSTDGYNEIDWHWENKLTTYFEEHTFFPSSSESPSLRQSYLTRGETFSDKIIRGTEVKDYKIPLTDYYPESKAIPQVELMLNGRQNGSSSTNILTSKNNTLLSSVNFNGFEGKVITAPIAVNELIGNELQLKFNSSNNSSIYSVTYINIEYPQKIKFNNSNIQYFKLPITSNKGYKFQIDNVPSKPLILLDITNKSQLQVLKTSVSNNKLIANLPTKPNSATKLLLSLEHKTPVSIANCEFKKIEPSLYNYIIITNSRLHSSAIEYAEYRKSVSGGSYKPYIADIVDIYNQFNYGEPSPVAIRNFVKYMISDKDYNKSLFLIGHTISIPQRTPRELIGVYDNNEEYKDMNLIPTVGYPGSDLLLVDGLDESQSHNIPAIPVGRISATDTYQVRNYLEKVIAYESNSQTDNAWKKNILHISGGKSTSEILALKSLLHNLEPIVKDGIVGGNPTPLIKTTLLPVEKLDISKQVNEGVGMITYFGHGSATSTDYNFGYTSALENNFRNINKYPLMYFNGCGVGNIFSGRYNTNLSQVDKIALSTDWLLSNDKGAIAILANSWDSYVSTSSKYLTTLYKYLFNNTSNLSVGEIQVKATKEIVLGSPSNYEIANLHQTILQGDPVLKIFSLPALDYSINPIESIVLKSNETNQIISNSDKLNIELIVQNSGRNDGNQKIPIEVVIHYQNQNTAKHSLIVDQIANRDTIQLLVPNTVPINRIDVHIDKENLIVESNKSNNNASLIIDWEIASQKTIYSSADFIDKISPVVKVLVNEEQLVNGSTVSSISELTINLTDNYSITEDINNLKVYLKECNTCNLKEVNNFESISSKALSNFEIEYKIGIDKLDAGEYQIMITGSDIAGNVSNPYFLTFQISSEKDKDIEYKIYPNPTSAYVCLQVSTSEFENDEYLSEIEYQIFNTKGDLISHFKDTQISYYNNKWYWTASSSGTYIYKIVCKGKNKIYKQSGQIIVQ